MSIPSTSGMSKKSKRNAKQPKNQELHIERPIYTIEDLHRASQYSVTEYSFRNRVRKCIRSIKPRQCFFASIPVLTWWPEYNWKKYLKTDMICGVTVFIMQIPQSMAYGLLANVPPVFGLYMAFYHALIYSIFGTSRQLSMGPFAITCLMTGDVIIEKTTVQILPNGTKEVINPRYIGVFGEVTNTQVGVTVAFAVAIAELVMYLIRLGIIENLLSNTMVSGFTCAAAFHVVASQIDDLLGLNLKSKRTGNFSLLLTLYDLLWALPNTNQMVALISAVSFLLIFINNELAKILVHYGIFGQTEDGCIKKQPKQPWMLKRWKIFFPMEIVVVIASTAISYTTRVYDTNNIPVAGPIPKGLYATTMKRKLFQLLGCITCRPVSNFSVFINTGLPSPTLPVMSLLGEIWMDAVVIALVSYITALSLALMFARKLMYEIDANQELLAYSLCNFIGSFLSCLPTGAAMSLSLLQEAMGGVTQIASIMSSSLLLLVLFYVGPFFEVLPRCVLAIVVTLALKNLLFKVKDFPLQWRLSNWDGFVWAVSFSTTIVMQISVGLAAGVAASLFSVAVQGLRLQAALLGRFNDTDLYLDLDHNLAAMELPGIKLLHYVGGVSFASRKSFKDLFIYNIGFDPAAVLKKRTRLREKGSDIDEVAEGLEMLVIILDFSSVTFLDPSGVDYLRHLQSDLHMLGITLLLAECSGRAYESIINCDTWEKKDSKLEMFPTVHDAVRHAETHIVNFL